MEIKVNKNQTRTAISTLTLHFKDIEAPDRCSGDLGLCVLGNFVAI